MGVPILTLKPVPARDKHAGRLMIGRLQFISARKDAAGMAELIQHHETRRLVS
jgi:hypothetical protein